MKKIAFGLIVPMIFTTFLSGCGGSTESSNPASSGSSGSPEYTFRVGTSQPAEHPMSIALDKFKEIVEKNSNGRIKVENYPANQLGNQTELNEGTRDGTISGNYSGFAYIGGNFEPKYNTFSLPFLITRENLDKAFEMLDGEIGKELSVKLEESGFKVLGYGNLGFRYITNSKHEIKTPDDLDGIKIRLQPNPVHIETFKTLGANPVAMDFAEVYSGLQQGVIDAQENPLDIIYANKFQEVQDYLTLSGHFFDFAAIWFNKKIYDELPEDLQKIVSDAGQEAMVFHRNLYKEKEQEYLQQLKDSGIQVYEPTPEEIKLFQEKAKPVYEKFLSETEDKEFAEKVINELTK